MDNNTEHPLNFSTVSARHHVIKEEISPSATTVVNNSPVILNTPTLIDSAASSLSAALLSIGCSSAAGDVIGGRHFKSTNENRVLDQQLSSRRYSQQQPAGYDQGSKGLESWGQELQGRQGSFNSPRRHSGAGSRGWGTAPGYRDSSYQAYGNQTVGMAMSNPDTKPDIMQLNLAAAAAAGSVSSTTGTNQFSAAALNAGGYSGRMGGAGYPPQPSSTGAPGMMPQGGYFDINMLAGSGGIGHPSQSPLQHSPAGGGSSASVSPSGFAGIQSPTSTMGHPFHGGAGGPAGGMMPGGAAAMMAQQKHICAICGDRASGKHYGVYSCEGCKGFFKRTVRKDLQYACRDEKICQIDKRQRNRCQYCRYMKCLNTGMKREAVQEERQRAKEKGETEVESTTSANSEMPVELILEAELSIDPILEAYVDAANDPSGGLFQAAEKQIYALVEWVKHVPHFVELPLEDQVILMRTGWNELLIAGFAHMSTTVKDGILLANGLCIYRNNAGAAGIGAVFDRVLTEIVSKIKEMGMDRTELGCLRAIVLFNPDCKGLGSIQSVESLREKVYASLEEYCKQQFPDEPGRFAKLLLRLPALRSIGLKCSEPIFFSKLINETTIDIFLTDVLESTSQN